jgi:hypothetical protein
MSRIVIVILIYRRHKPVEPSYGVLSMCNMLALYKCCLEIIDLASQCFLTSLRGQFTCYIFSLHLTMVRSVERRMG